MKDETAGLRKILEEHPEWADWTYDEFTAELCRLEAEVEDRENRRTRVYRENGYLAPYDCRLFVSVWRGYTNDADPAQLMEAIRLKKRRGHKQQEALEIWDAHYARLDHSPIPDRETAERLETIFESLEESREQKVAKKKAAK